MVRLIQAIIVATIMITVTAIGFMTTARPLDVMLDRFNSTFHTLTGGSGTGWVNFNRINVSVHVLWLVIPAMVILFYIAYVYLTAQRREYVGGYY